MAKVFVIAGHGAGDPGASGNGYTEAERVRALANRVKALGGDNVMLADTSRNWYADGGISTLAISRDYQIVELHMDSGAASARGGHVIVNGAYQADEYDKALADFISGILPGRSNKLVGRTDLANLNRAAAKGYSSRLIECGFISNAEDVAIFNSRMDEIATGILNAFGISLGGWQKDAVGWWWKNADGSYPTLAWKLINHHWYYFGEKGYMVTGWKVIGGSWYYFGADGAMKTGWQAVNGNWFYLDQSGRMYEKKWLKDKEKWYWFKAGGYMAKNEVLEIDKKYYAFLPDGHMATSIESGGAIS